MSAFFVRPLNKIRFSKYSELLRISADLIFMNIKSADIDLIFMNIKSADIRNSSLYLLNLILFNGRTKNEFISLYKFCWYLIGKIYFNCITYITVHNSKCRIIKFPFI